MLVRISFLVAMALVLIWVNRKSMFNAVVSCTLFSPFLGEFGAVAPGVTFSRIMLIPFVAYLFVGLLTNHRVYLKNWYAIVGLTILGGFACIKVLVDNSLNLVNYLDCLIMLGYIIIAMSILVNGSSITPRVILAPCLLGGTILAIVGLIQVHGGSLASWVDLPTAIRLRDYNGVGGSYLYRPTGFHSNPNGVAVYYVVASLCWLWVYLHHKKGVGWFFLLPLFLTVYALALTYSRSANGAFIFSSILLIILSTPHISRAKARGALMGAAIVGIVAAILVASTRIFGGDSDQTRVALYSGTWSALITDPMVVCLGLPLSNNLNVHNGYLQVLVKYGLVVTLIYTSIIFIGIKRSAISAKMNASSSLVLALLTSFAIGDITHSTAVGSIIFWVCLGLALRCKNSSEMNSIRNKTVNSILNYSETSNSLGRHKAKSLAQ